MGYFSTSLLTAQRATIRRQKLYIKFTVEPIYFHVTSLAAGFTKEEVTGKAIEHA